MKGTFQQYESRHIIYYLILYTILQHSTIKWMNMNGWHTVIQCTIVFRLSPKDTRPHPNTLPIQSLPGVNFWVVHHRDISPFLICLTRAFTFHHYFIFFSSFFFHFIHFSKYLSFLHTTMMQMNATISKISQ